MLSELKEAGVDVASAGYLLQGSKAEYQQAVPILLKWLPRIENRYVKEDIVRTLTMKWAGPQAAPPLIKEFERRDDELGVKWTIGNALSVVADDSVYDEIARIARDKTHGRAREMITYALGNMKNPAAVDVLCDLLDDNDVAGHALRPLGKLRASKARAKIELFLNHPKGWVRKEAKRALAKIDRAEGS
jgi:HEAT repeat protein